MNYQKEVLTGKPEAIKSFRFFCLKIIREVKKEMKRNRLASLLLIGAITLSTITACSGQNAGNNSNTASQANGDVDIVIGTANGSLCLAPLHIAIDNGYFEEEFKNASDKCIVMTDDGSYGNKGNVTMPLKEMLEAKEDFDCIITIGPLIMMKFVVSTAKPYSIPVTVSMNPIMIDGTGMCGGCRLTLVKEDGKRVTKFACIDGPDFNGYEIDFDEAMMRSRQYAEFEKKKREETCALYKKAN